MSLKNLTVIIGSVAVMAGAAQAAQSCEALAAGPQSWPDTTMRILSAVAQPQGIKVPFWAGGDSGPLPSHCEIKGVLHERIGRDGEHYAINFHLRLPDKWNGRFLFEGGGGTDGWTGDAIGVHRVSGPTALAQGYAVVAENSGHANWINNKPETGGIMTFGRDPQARADYGHAALKTTYDAARAVINRFYGHSPEYSYFAGCSKGGQEAMAFAERYPQAFDGILAGAPGLSMPRSALVHPWSAQVFAGLLGGGKNKSIPITKLPDSYSDTDLKLARQAVLDACDADDGLKDGIVGAFGQCTTAKVHAEFRKIQCQGNKTASCLNEAQIAALEKVYEGPKNSKGEALYASFPWDGGMADGWRGWSIGTPSGPKVWVPPGTADPLAAIPPVSVTMGAGTLSGVFSVPPTVVASDPQSSFDYLLGFDFDKDAPAIYATSAEFPRSGWDDNNARNTDLRDFRAHGGKLLVYHGTADGIFSVSDTTAWWDEVNARLKGHAADTVRVFPVPGMGHCLGGLATDQFEPLNTLVDWVEHGKAPDRIVASTNQWSPWQGRTRPLCPHPAIARYSGKGDSERAENFVCVKPK